MANKKKLLVIAILAIIAFNTAVSGLMAQTAPVAKSEVPIAKTEAEPAKDINPLELVGNPQVYLQNKVKISATFDKFSTLGLDYKPALRDSKKYISFLIRRPDIADHTIPLSELKLIIPRDKAEKLIDLESGDKIELTGQVFSSAMNDPWIDVDNVKIVSTKTKTVADKKKVEQANKNKLQK